MTNTAHRNLLLAAVALPLLLAAVPRDAEAKLAFFRNYPDLKWNVIKTEHFNVFYPESKDPDSEHYVNGEYTARKTAYVAEEMYPLVCGQFNYYLDETVNIVMLDQTDDLTGYTIPAFDWIVVSGRHSDMLWRVRGHHDWLRNVLYHEFSHVVSLKADHVFAEEAFGVSLGAHWNDGRINTSAGAEAFIGDGDPWFWVEGGAEYYTDVAGINSWTSNRDMRLRVDTLEGALLSFDDMQDYFGSNGGFDGNRHYDQGYSMATYLEERFGEGVFQQFGVEREKQGWTPEFLGVIEATLNISAEELDRDWRAWMKAKYEKVRDDVMKEPAIGQRVGLERKYYENDDPADVEHDAYIKTFKGGDRYKWRRDREMAGGTRDLYTWSPRFSADGKRWGSYSLYGSALTIRDVPESEYPVFNPDQPWRDDGDEVREEEKKLLGARTLHLDVLPWEGDGQFDFSPDGRKIVTVCKEDYPKSRGEALGWFPTDRNLDMDGWGWHTLCVIDLEKVEKDSRELMEGHFGYDPMEKDAERMEMVRRNVTPPADHDRDTKTKEWWLGPGRSGPKFPPENRWGRRDWYSWANGNDYLVEPQVLGKEPIRRVSYPVWSPDGKTIAFVKYDDLNQEMWLLDLGTQEASQLTSFGDATRIEIVDWSPDGTQLVAGVFRWNQADIYVFGVDGSIRPLTMDRFEDRDPHWGHDGNIYFSSDRIGGIFDIFRINPRIDPARADRDLDGILDSEDACADQRETRNLFRDADGCPDSIPVRVTAERIEIGEKVFFELDQAVIKPESFELLDAVARVIGDNPQIRKIEVAGHTDSQGKPDYNLDLSSRRAAAVAEYLAGKGVASERLISAGYGQTRPLVEGATEEAYSTNRRVEFLILGQDEVTKVVEQAPTQPATGRTACGQGPQAEILENAYLVQVTNDWSGDFTPWLTPAGNLLYSRHTAFGFKDWGLHCSEFANKVVDHTSLVIPPEDWRTEVPQETLPDYSAMTEPVKVHGAFWRNPAVIPIIEVSNTSLSHIALDVGALLWVSDTLDTNELYVYGSVGERLMAQIFYTNKSLWPELSIFGLAQSIKWDYGFNLDDDGDLRTTDDQFLADIKIAYGFLGGGASLLLPFAGNFNVDLSTFHYGIATQGVDDGKRWSPYVYRGMNNLTFNLVSSSIADNLEWWNPANPRGGRGFSFSWMPNFTVPLNQTTGGVSVDDGQVFDRYYYNEFQWLYSEYISLPIKKPNGEDAQHTLQLNAQVGLIDRNVPYADEIRGGAGAQVFRTNPFQSMTTFAGYGPYTLAGETAALLNVQYRFPVARQIDVKLGPLYIEAIYAQFFGTVGNFWSYRLKEDAQTVDIYGEHVLADEVARQGGGLDRAGSGITREWPGMIASENGWPILADVGFEMRFLMNLFNQGTWYSSVRVAYGFMGVSGRGDMDGDDVYTNSSDPTLDNRTNEKEPAGFRFTIGIGSGW